MCWNYFLCILQQVGAVSTTIAVTVKLPGLIPLCSYRNQNQNRCSLTVSGNPHRELQGGQINCSSRNAVTPTRNTPLNHKLFLHCVNQSASEVLVEALLSFEQSQANYFPLPPLFVLSQANHMLQPHNTVKYFFHVLCTISFSVFSFCV